MTDASQRVRGEIYLARKLLQLHYGDVFAGITDSAIVRERIRAAILEHHAEQLSAGWRDGVQVSYGQAFEELYGEKLHTQSNGDDGIDEANNPVPGAD